MNPLHLPLPPTPLPEGGETKATGAASGQVWGHVGTDMGEDTCGHACRVLAKGPCGHRQTPPRHNSQLPSPVSVDGRLRPGPGPGPASRGPRLRKVVQVSGWKPRQMGHLISTHPMAQLLEFSVHPRLSSCPRGRGRNRTLASECLSALAFPCVKSLFTWSPVLLTILLRGCYYH